MSKSTEWAMDKGIKFGAVFAEVSSSISYGDQDVDTLQLNPIAKAAFGFASVTFEVRLSPLLSEAEMTLGCPALEGKEQL